MRFLEKRHTQHRRAVHCFCGSKREDVPKRGCGRIHAKKARSALLTPTRSSVCMLGSAALNYQISRLPVAVRNWLCEISEIQISNGLPPPDDTALAESELIFTEP